MKNWRVWPRRWSHRAEFWACVRARMPLALTSFAPPARAASAGRGAAGGSSTRDLRAQLTRNCPTLPKAAISERSYLPYETAPGCLHVLAAAIAGSADQIITLNAKDFPRQILREEGLERCDPDALLMSFRSEDADRLDRVAQAGVAEACRARP